MLTCQEIILSYKVTFCYKVENIIFPKEELLLYPVKNAFLILSYKSKSIILLSNNILPKVLILFYKIILLVYQEIMLLH